MSQGHDAIYKAMADEHRRTILMTLCREPLVAGELAQLVGLAPNALSFHLKWLKSAGLVSVDREGRFLRYRANPNLLSEWARHILSTFNASPSMRRFQQESVAAAVAEYRDSEHRESADDGRPRDPEVTDYAYTSGAVNGDDVLPTELL
jgi:DNA-binding transcriptional ArsR family regulator